MHPSSRQEAVKKLYEIRNDIITCRDVEAICHAISSCPDDYFDHISRASFHLRLHVDKGAEIVLECDHELAQGTLAGRIQEENEMRVKEFKRMLSERYEALNDRKFAAVVRCRRCGSNDVSWEEKQTRSADEGCTAFVTCCVCKNRWIMR